MSAKHTPTPLMKTIPVNDALPYLGPSNVDCELVDIKGESVGLIFEKDRAELIVEAVNASEKLKAENDSLRSSNAALLLAAKAALAFADQVPGADRLGIHLAKAIAQAEKENEL